MSHRTTPTGAALCGETPADHAALTPERRWRLVDGVSTCRRCELRAALLDAIVSARSVPLGHAPDPRHASRILRERLAPGAEQRGMVAMARAMAADLTGDPTLDRGAYRRSRRLRTPEPDDANGASHQAQDDAGIHVERPGMASA